MNVLLLKTITAESQLSLPFFAGSTFSLYFPGVLPVV